MNKVFYSSSNIFWLSQGTILMWLRNNNQIKGHFTLFQNMLRVVNENYGFEDILLVKNIIYNEKIQQKIEKFPIFHVTSFESNNEYIKNKYKYKKPGQFCLEFKLKEIKKFHLNFPTKELIRTEACGDFLIVFDNEQVLKIWIYLLEIFLNQTIDIINSSTNLHPINNTIYKEQIFDTILNETLLQDDLVNKRRKQIFFGPLQDPKKNMLFVKNKNPIELCLKLCAVLVEPFEDEYNFFEVKMR